MKTEFDKEELYYKYCWTYAVALAKRLSLKHIYGWIDIGSDPNDINHAVMHMVVKYHGKYYDAQGETNSKKLTEVFGEGIFHKYNVTDASKEAKWVVLTNTNIMKDIREHHLDDFPNRSSTKKNLGY